MSANRDMKELFEGLKTLSESGFPKKCGSCGAIFSNAEEFLEKTAGIDHKSGMKQSEDDYGKRIVEIFRNCPCGSTLMEEFHDRRDESEKGKLRRASFEKILAYLVNKGIPMEKGRLEILSFMRGGKSSIIEEMIENRGH